MCPSKQPLSLQLLITLSVLFNTIIAASILRRDPSTLINIRQPGPKPEPLPEANNPGRLIISGHGVVAVPISQTGERVHVEINSSPANENPNQETNGGGSEPDSDSEYIKLVKVGDTTFQIIGTELTITDDRDDSSLPGSIANDGGRNNEGGLGDQRLTPGQQAAMEFAKTAEEIEAGKNRVLGGTATVRDDSSDGVELGPGGRAQDHGQPLAMGRRRRGIR